MGSGGYAAVDHQADATALNRADARHDDGRRRYKGRRRGTPTYSREPFDTPTSLRSAGCGEAICQSVRSTVCLILPQARHVGVVEAVPCPAAARALVVTGRSRHRSGSPCATPRLRARIRQERATRLWCGGSYSLPVWPCRVRVASALGRPLWVILRPH